MNEHEQLAKDNGMTIEFVNWFFDNKKEGCGNAWFMMMAAMWEGWIGREAKCSVLAEENAGLKEICDDRRRFIMNGVQMGYIKVPAAETDPDLETIRIAISPQKPIPATDAFLAELRAQGVEMC